MASLIVEAVQPGTARVAGPPGRPGGAVDEHRGEVAVRAGRAAGVGRGGGEPLLLGAAPRRVRAGRVGRRRRDGRRGRAPDGAIAGVGVAPDRGRATGALPARARSRSRSSTAAATRAATTAGNRRPGATMRDTLDEQFRARSVVVEGRGSEGGSPPGEPIAAVSVETHRPGRRVIAVAGGTVSDHRARVYAVVPATVGTRARGSSTRNARDRRSLALAGRGTSARSPSAADGGRVRRAAGVRRAPRAGDRTAR